MKRLYIFILILQAAWVQAQVEVEQVSVGAGYTQQAFYDLETGNITAIDNEAWDIAFSAIGATDAGIFINEGSSYEGTALRLYETNATAWADPIDAQGFTESTPVLYNNEENWTVGAFNTVKDPSDPFDYGWGAYNPSTHQLTGTKIYVIKMRDGSFLKFQVESLVGGTYNIRYGSLDGETSTTAAISKDAADGSGLVYFSFATGTVLDMPAGYDLIFTRYITPLDAGDGTLLDYSVTGVLIAPGVEAAIAKGVDVETVEEADFEDAYAAVPDTIGHEWKAFDFTAGWLIDDTRAQFVKTAEGNVYKVVFLDFEGSSTGVTTVEKTFVRTLSSTTDVDAPLNITLYPNPVTERLNVSGLESDAEAYLYDMKGNVVLETTLNGVEDMINVQDLPTGTYSLVLKSKETASSHIIVVR